MQPGLRHHKLPLIQNPGLDGLLSAESGESTESGEVVQVALGSSSTSVAAVPTDAVLDPVMELLPTPPVLLTAADPDIVDVVPTAGSDPTAALPAGDDRTKAMVKKRAVQYVEQVIMNVTEMTLPVPRCPGRIRHY